MALSRDGGGMGKQEVITVIKNTSNEVVKDIKPIEDNSLFIDDNMSIFLSNHEIIELYTGNGCDIEISDCQNVTIYCDSDCNIIIRNQCDIEIFSEDNCRIVFCGNRARGGRVVCGDNCHLICWPHVEIESGNNCKIDCDSDCSIDCRNGCVIKGNKPRYSFSVKCMDDCSIICNKQSKIDTRFNCNITWVDDNGNPL